MKLTKIILYLLTVLTLISAMGLGALAVLYEWGGGWRGAVAYASQGYPHAKLALGAVLTAILLQIVGIGLKILNKQDVKRELRCAARIITLLIFVPVAVWVTFLSGNPLFLVLVIGIVVVVVTQWW